MEVARYTRTDLLRLAAEHRLHLTDRMLTNWIECGLFDVPRRGGRGRGRGSVEGTWSRAHCGMLLAILRHRQEVTRIQPLLSIPVWLWLHGAEDRVSVRQVRRALRTWVARGRRATPRASRASARQTVQMVSHPNALPDDRAEMRGSVAAMLRSGQSDPEDLSSVVRRVMDPDLRGATWGGRESDLGAEDVVDWIRGAYAAADRLHVLDGPEAVPDWLFHWARWAFLDEEVTYAAEHEERARLRRIGRYFSPPTLDDSVLRSCWALVQTLGFGLIHAESDAQEREWHPALWRERNLMTVLHVRETAVGLQIDVVVREGPSAH